MKILHIISDKNIGGAGRLLLNLLHEADISVFDISVILPRGSMLTRLIEELGEKAVEVDAFNLKTLYREIKKQAPDIVHTHAAGGARVAAKLCGSIATVNTKHCANDSYKRKSLLKKAVIRCFDKLFTDFTIATAHYAREALMRDGIQPNKIKVIINGSLPLKELSTDEKAKARKKLGYTEEDFLVGIVGRLEHGKGQEIFIRAAEICQKTAPQIKFLIVGSGSMEKELKSLASELENIKFLGFLPDVTEIMNILEANVNCSYLSETSSLSLSEGMSVGAIPIVSDCGGNAFMASDCGLVFPKKDAPKLADALISLSKSPSTVSSLKAKAIQKFAQNFTATKMAKETEGLYFKLADLFN